MASKTHIEIEKQRVKALVDQYAEDRAIDQRALETKTPDNPHGNRPHDYGTPERRAWRLLVSHGRDEAQTYDALGRIWCAGFLDQATQPGAELLDCGRIFGGLWRWRYGQTMPGVMQWTDYIQRSHFSLNINPDDFSGDVRKEQKLHLIETALFNAGRSAKSTVRAVVIDHDGLCDPWWMQNYLDIYANDDGSRAHKKRLEQHLLAAQKITETLILGLEAIHQSGAISLNKTKGKKDEE